VELGEGILARFPRVQHVSVDEVAEGVVQEIVAVAIHPVIGTVDIDGSSVGVASHLIEDGEGGGEGFHMEGFVVMVARAVADVAFNSHVQASSCGAVQSLQLRFWTARSASSALMAKEPCGRYDSLE